jgi:hypothetical protein
VLVLLVIVYSLPVYQREISALLGHIGLSSLKTPIGELTFTEHSRFQGAVVSAAKPTGEERSSALPRPSYPRPGLDSLRHAVSEDPTTTSSRMPATSPSLTGLILVRARMVSIKSCSQHARFCGQPKP